LLVILKKNTLTMHGHMNIKPKNMLPLDYRPEGHRKGLQEDPWQDSGHDGKTK